MPPTQADAGHHAKLPRCPPAALPQTPPSTRRTVHSQLTYPLAGRGQGDSWVGQGNSGAGVLLTASQMFSTHHKARYPHGVGHCPRWPAGGKPGVWGPFCSCHLLGPNQVTAGTTTLPTPEPLDQPEPCRLRGLLRPGRPTSGEVTSRGARLLMPPPLSSPATKR